MAGKNFTLWFIGFGRIATDGLTIGKFPAPFVDHNLLYRRKTVEFDLPYPWILKVLYIRSSHSMEITFRLIHKKPLDRLAYLCSII